MVCLSCHVATRGALCRRCSASLRRANERLLPGGIMLISAYEHSGAARALVHHLKYRGMVGYAEMVADVIADRVPAVPLVPVPRALSRRLKYGVDPARVIALALARRVRVPVVDAFAPRIHSPRRAGRARSAAVPPFRLRTTAPREFAVVDDVVTSGGTALAAVKAVEEGQVTTVIAANLATELVSRPHD